MARQRQVFPRDEVAHLWAHKAQDSARDSGGSFYFTGPTLYSYGSHFVIAHILADECGPQFAGRVLWNDAGYSNTTGKHKSIAWRALTRQQKENALHMPASIGMGRNVDPHRIERDLKEKRLPDVAALLVARVIECVSEIAGKRYGSGPFENLLNEARKAETLAGLMYARAKRKYPLAAIDSSPVSSDKKEWAAWIKSMASGKMKIDYAEALKNAQHYLEHARINAARCGSGFPYIDHRPGCEYQSRNIISGTYDAAQKSVRFAQDAKRLYALLNGLKKKSPGLLKIEKEAQALAALFLARRTEFEMSETRSRLIYDIREAARAVKWSKARNVKRELTERTWSNMETLSTRAAECGLTDSLYAPLAARLSRIGAAMTAKSTLKAVHSALETAQSFMPQFPGDALRHAGNALLKYEFIQRLDVRPAMLVHMGLEMSDVVMAANKLKSEAKAGIIEKNAETLRAWLACESNVRPSYDAGTFARINGPIVETTRGANVPIEHACRLARMYSIAVRKGGAEWADGNGPMVGHYRVNKIGADGALIIGCHEFSPEEAKRLHALLESCEACGMYACKA